MKIDYENIDSTITIRKKANFQLTTLFEPIKRLQWEGNQQTWNLGIDSNL